MAPTTGERPRWPRYIRIGCRLQQEEFVKGLKTTHGIETGKFCFAHPDRPEIEMQLNT